MSVSRTTLRNHVSVCTLSLALFLGTAGAIAAEDRKVYVIEAQSTAAALNAFARQSGLQLMFDYAEAARTTAPVLKGSYTRKEALAILLANTRFEVGSEDAGVIYLKVSERQGSAGAAAVEAEPTEVIVTGSYIRNSQPTAPMRSVGRSDLDAAGYGQLGDVVRGLPENFAGGQNPTVVGSGPTNIGNQNITNASTFNLRGLGTDATLVLLNGHRLASDSFFQGVDISGIPLAAVQRIEIVTDGASALYGSDAVAGVANIILRKNYDGAEVSARLGGTTQGGGFEQTYSALIGRSSAEGHALLNVEYSDQEGITAGQRDFTQAAAPASNLLRPQTRRSAFVSLGRDLTPTLSLSFDGLVSDRTVSSVDQYLKDYDAYYITSYNPNYNLAWTLDMDIGDWGLKATAGLAGSRNSVWTRAPGYVGQSNFRNGIEYLEVVADGPIVSGPTGTIKGAIGGGRRTESFANGLASRRNFYQGERHVDYLFAEVLAPLISASENRIGLQALDLSLSARTERYSDFGSTTNPRVGLRYVPVSGLTVRTSWGKSFKAPSFLQMYQTPLLYLYRASAFGYTGGGTALMTWGGNRDLRPERATSRTFGAEYRPEGIRSMVLSATWFDIDYRDRVIQPISPTSAGLSNPIFAAFVEWNPSPARQSDLIAGASTFTNFSGAAYNPATVVAVQQNRYANATAQTVEGVDLGYRQSFALARGGLSAALNATWMDVRQQTLTTTPEFQLSGTIFNVPAFKARAGLTWTRGAFSAAGFVNHIAEEDDTGVSPNRRIGAWTTADATLSWRFGDTVPAFRGVKLALAVTNLFDQDPPIAYSPSLDFEGISFDSTNTTVIGRTVALTLTKSW
ncbi:TonB-dependent receptor [Asticcacaulis sp. DW145]|uniref:TonB-dependent receptor n=1 Tax=Asticcacaulis currens TaxID=2984210 RepID=A0ABT5IB28_9CAUL|nr:TonB-dependent receptor [Asticcacaulis currens]MDC7693376.1 TonB-dependent receptor [Asticcacaulis currens]BEV10597.1 TonB-dependent receptor [Asticcacaulis sp. DW145]